MQAKDFFPFVVAAAIVVAPVAASAATVIGTVSYIAADGKSIILNSTDEYTLGPKVDVSKLGISQRVKVTWSGPAAKRVATDIGPEPVAGK